MAEKLSLKWNDFENTIKGTFGCLRDRADFVDVTLAFEDGQQVEAHRANLRRNVKDTQIR